MSMLLDANIKPETVSEAEWSDIKETKLKIYKNIVDTFEVMRMYTRMSTEELSNCGHSNHMVAVYRALTTTIERNDKLWKEFLKKWPDEK